MSELLSVRDAQNRILASFRPLPAEKVSLETACYRILAEDFFAPFDSPPFDNSSVDGFALCVDPANSIHPQAAAFPIQGDIPAGIQPLQPVLPGQAYRIMTGAPLPPGANAVIPVEDTDFPYREPEITLPSVVKVTRLPQPGENIRPRGQDFQKGDLLLAKGRKLLPQDVGLIAASGIAALPVVRQPRIALFSTGDELLRPGEDRLPGKIYDANSITLTHLVQREGAQVISLGLVPDSLDAVRAALRNAVAANVDFILSSAGVSVGAYDYVRKTIEESGSLSLWRVNMRPGKPLAFGSFQNTPIISLPGNPVSAFIGALVFVHPVIRCLSGLNEPVQPTIAVSLEHPVESDGRESYLRAVISPTTAGFSARLTGHQGSGNLFSLVQANALLIIPAGVKSLPAGEIVQAWPFQTY